MVYVCACFLMIFSIWQDGHRIQLLLLMFVLLFLLTIFLLSSFYEIWVIRYSKFNIRLLSSNVDRFNIILCTFSLAPFVLALFMAYVVVVVRNSSNPAQIHWQHGGINLSTNAYITSLPLFSSFLLLLLYFPSIYCFADALFHLMSLYIFYISKHCGADAKV